MDIFKIKFENEFEADVFADILEKEGIPYVVVPNYSLAYDGLFEVAMGWGHIEIPSEHKGKAEMLYDNYKKSIEK